MLYDEYEAYVDKYTVEFGKRTIVLYECGSFFEMYDDGTCKTNLQEIGDLLNIIVSRRNKNILEVSRSNCEMAGFPSHALKKFLNILLAANYTIVLVRQVTPPPNPKREVTEILSPGTNLEVDGGDSNNLMVIQLEEVDKYGSNGFDICMGCACVDLSTGNSVLYEATTHKHDTSYVYDELQRLVMTYRPCEIEVFNTEPLTHVTFHEVSEHVNFGKAYIHNKIDAHGVVSKKYRDVKYQQQVLSIVYPNRGLLTPLEFTSLERCPYAATCFTRMVEFAHMHNESIVKKLNKPIIQGEQDTMILSNNAIQQLDLAKRNAGEGSLLDMLNNAKTAIGRRYFRDRMLCPHVRIDQNDLEFDAMDALTDDIVKDIRKNLLKVYDLERLFRKCTLGRIHPHEFEHIYTSLCSLSQCNGASTVTNNAIMHGDDVLVINDMLSFFEQHFDVHKLGMYAVEAITDAALFKYQSENMSDYQGYIERAQRCVADFVAQFHPEGILKMDINDKDGMVLTMTSKRFQDASKCYPHKKFYVKDPRTDGMISFMWKDMVTKTMTTYVRITHPLIEQHNVAYLDAKQRMCKECQTMFCDVVRKFVDEFSSSVDHNKFQRIIDVIARIDWLTTCRFNALHYKLTRPRFVRDSVSGEFDIKGIRHLLIEKYQQHIEYVTNDVSLDRNGMLLYGINSSGKSSLMKAIGLAVIMAQAGMYVPCDSMSLSPFKTLFTRILTGDDIQRGHSTFTKEILELRNILARADAHSLVIGDELCAGTESSSALAIVAAGIVTLTKKNASFVFATHLHDLVSLPEINENPKVAVYHLAVCCDATTNKLIYERKLRSGSGSSLYGIEVCRSMDMDPEFLNIANSIRQRYNGIDKEVDVGSKSRYNALVNVRTCQVCGKKADEVHHIQQQKLADENGYIGKYHRNRQSNLACLCTTCHDAVHAGKVDIKGYVSTLDGRHLVIVDTGKPNDEISLNEDDMIYDIVSVFKNDDNEHFKTKKSRYDYLISKWNISKYKIMQTLKKHSVIIQDV